jgi:hypothetical protein
MKKATDNRSTQEPEMIQSKYVLEIFIAKETQRKARVATVRYANQSTTFIPLPAARCLMMFG